VTHKGYHSAAMDKEVGYNIYLPPGYESAQSATVVYWLHGRNNTRHPTATLCTTWRRIAGGKLPPMILVYAAAKPDQLLRLLRRQVHGGDDHHPRN